MDTIPSKLSARMPLLGAGVPAETMTLLTSLLLEEALRAFCRRFVASGAVGGAAG